MRALLSISLASILVLVTLNLRVSAHFCGGDLKSAAIIGEATPCSHAQPENDDLPTCHKHTDEESEGKGCCEDVEYVVEGLDFDTLMQDVTATLAPDFDISEIVWSEFQLIPKQLFFHPPQYLNYKPPLIKQDIPVLSQSFLI